MNEAELLKKIKDAEQQIADARRMLEEYRKCGVVRPAINEEYYYIDSCGKIIRTIWLDDDLDKVKFEIGNVFNTRDDAERAVRRRKTHQKLKELAAKWNDEPIIVDKYQTKYGLYLLASGRLEMYSTDYATVPNTVYFNHNVLDDILEEIPEDELIEYCKGDY